jgi:hypothetical protein
MTIQREEPLQEAFLHSRNTNATALIFSPAAYPRDSVFQLTERSRIKMMSRSTQEDFLHANLREKAKSKAEWQE